MYFHTILIIFTVYQSNKKKGAKKKILALTLISAYDDDNSTE